jgi:NADH:ubiquinone reductase (non-electrogenic)
VRGNLAACFVSSISHSVIAVGARAATFGVPGVKDFTFPLRQLSDARAIRTRLVEVFERASSPFCDDTERARLLNFVIVGGGPTSIEFAAELYDFLQQDVKKLFPALVPFCHVSLVEASSRVLGSFSANLSEYVKKLYESRDIKLLLGRSVKEVHAHHLELSDGSSVKYGLCVWSTGNEMLPFVRQLPFAKETRQPRRLLVDDHLRVLGSDSIYAAGDCAAEEAAPKPGTAQVAAQQGKVRAAVVIAVILDNSLFSGLQNTCLVELRLRFDTCTAECLRMWAACVLWQICPFGAARECLGGSFGPARI